jgi:hypothetical protein
MQAKGAGAQVDPRVALPVLPLQPIWDTRCKHHLIHPLPDLQLLHESRDGEWAGDTLGLIRQKRVDHLQHFTFSEVC